MKQLKFKMTATTTSGGRPNKPNEDNFQADDDLSDGLWQWITNKEQLLSPKGALLVVSDGMGGMNAGDRASALTIETVKEFFASDRLTDDIIKSQKSIYAYMEKTIVEADRRIKEEGNANPEKEGMGATIVLAWFINNMVHIAWCGDSRAYLYNPIGGLRQISKDHSYVQELVDKGLLLPELAFDHPNNNIITRSLGDPSKIAKPDFVSEPLCNNDIILICSDGLHGVLRDAEIERVIADNIDNILACQNALLDAAKNADWSDNTTVNLLQVMDGGEDRKPLPPPNKPSDNSTDFSNTADELSKSFYKKAVTKLNKNVKCKNWLIAALITFLIIAIAALLFLLFPKIFSSSSSLKCNPNSLTFNIEAAGHSSQTVSITPHNIPWTVAPSSFDQWIKCEKSNDSTLKVSLLEAPPKEKYKKGLFVVIFDTINKKITDTLYITLTGNYPEIAADTSSSIETIGKNIQDLAPIAKEDSKSIGLTPINTSQLPKAQSDTTPQKQPQSTSPKSDTKDSKSSK